MQFCIEMKSVEKNNIEKKLLTKLRRKIFLFFLYNFRKQNFLAKSKNKVLENRQFI